MVGVGQEHRGQLVEADHAIGLGIGDLRRFRSLLQTGIVRRGITQGHRDLAAEPVLIDVVEGATDQGAELVDRRTEIARTEQLVVQPAGLRSEEHTSELQSRPHLVCRLLLEKKKNNNQQNHVEYKYIT